ncbi:conserved hypothetical protein [Ricinus communis]|uniref:Uncharacterized protein n=1 Tax=Ricinus communis TaxID=3988 RepID=B9SFT2_RICCO|nr:conserved hypothetical protein [Ricinus communis]
MIILAMTLVLPLEMDPIIFLRVRVLRSTGSSRTRHDEILEKIEKLQSIFVSKYQTLGKITDDILFLKQKGVDVDETSILKILTEQEVEVEAKEKKKKKKDDETSLSRLLQKIRS